MPQRDTKETRISTTITDVALSLRGVRKAFGKVVVLDDVSFDVPAASTLGVIGPNGAGKSTLLSIIAGIQKPDLGEVTVCGARIDKVAPHRAVRRGVVLVHQIPRPFAAMTVLENLRVASLVIDNRATARGLIESALAVSGLRPQAGRLARDLPLLDRKRLGLARALVTDPRVLLLDEVAAGLTLDELAELIALVEQIAATGTTLVIVEHVDAIIRRLASRVIVLDWGTIIAQGTPAEVRDNERVREVYLGTPKQHDRAVDHAIAVSHTHVERKTLLHFSHVSARYNGPLALDDLSLTVGEGEVVAVLGANGAGKSTFARTAAGLMVPSSGAIYWRDADITKSDARERADLGIALCPEGRRIFTDLSVEENLRIGAYAKRARADEETNRDRVFALFPILREKRNDPAALLSGGQQQMLALGRALMAAPLLMIIDEVSLGLAPVAIDAIYEALAEIRTTGVAIVLIEQAAYRSLALADRAYVLDHGRLAFAGGVAELENDATLARAYFGTPEAATTSQPIGDVRS